MHICHTETWSRTLKELPRIEHHYRKVISRPHQYDVASLFVTRIVQSPVTESYSVCRQSIWQKIDNNKWSHWLTGSKSDKFFIFCHLLVSLVGNSIFRIELESFRPGGGGVLKEANRRGRNLRKTFVIPIQVRVQNLTVTHSDCVITF